jgi:hypothetical protein
MRITRTGAATGATLLALGALGGAAVSSQPDRPPAAQVPKAVPAEVRTVVVTRTIHRVRHERAPRPAHPVAAPPPVPAAPAPASRVVQVAAAPRPRVPLRAVAPRPAPKPLRSHTSGAAGHHGEGDDGGEGGDD